jgi:hypothetical protein
VSIKKGSQGHWKRKIFLERSTEKVVLGGKCNNFMHMRWRCTWYVSSVFLSPVFIMYQWSFSMYHWVFFGASLVFGLL